MLALEDFQARKCDPPAYKRKMLTRKVQQIKMLLFSPLPSHVTQTLWFLFSRDREENHRAEEKAQTITGCSFQANAGQRRKWWEKHFILAERITVSKLIKGSSSHQTHSWGISEAEMGEFLTLWAAVRSPDTAFRRHSFFEASSSHQLPFCPKGQHPPVLGRGVARSFLLTSSYQTPGEGVRLKACKRYICKFKHYQHQELWQDVVTSPVQHSWENSEGKKQHQKPYSWKVSESN